MQIKISGNWRKYETAGLWFLAGSLFPIASLAKIRSGLRFPIILFPVFFIFMSACLPGRQKDDKPVARVGDTYLYISDIKEAMPAGLPEKDSLMQVQAFVRKWTEKKLLLNKAELNLTKDKLNVEKQLADYRSSLLIYAYENELVKQKLNTEVPDKEIEAYYHKNKHNFELKDYIVRVLYLKLSSNSPGMTEAEEWIQSGNKEDLVKLEEYCHKYAVNYFMDKNSWLYFDHLLKEIPLETYNKEEFLKNNNFVEFEDDEYIYMLKIIDFRLKDGISPLSLERDNIRNIILNKRKLTLVNRMKKDIYEDALSKNNIEFY